MACANIIKWSECHNLALFGYEGSPIQVFFFLTQLPSVVKQSKNIISFVIKHTSDLNNYEKKFCDILISASNVPIWNFLKFNKNILPMLNMQILFGLKYS